jgi:hypothetical protein
MPDQYINGDVSRFILNAIRAGFAYRAGTLFTEVADTETKKLLIENTNADAAVFVSEPTISSDGQYHAKKVANPTVDTAGDAATVTNKRTDLTDTGGVTATTAGDAETGVLSGGTAYPEVTAGSGSNAANQQPGASPATGVSDMILPGESLSLEATNVSGGTRETSITAECVVIPTTNLGL